MEKKHVVEVGDKEYHEITKKILSGVYTDMKVFCGEIVRVTKLSESFIEEDLCEKCQKIMLEEKFKRKLIVS